MSLLRRDEESLAKITGYTIKLVEQAVRSLKQALQRTNPWKTEPCPRTDCVPSTAEEGPVGQCRDRGIVYSNTCSPATRRGS